LTPAEVVGQDENDVGILLFLLFCTGIQGEYSKEQHRDRHNRKNKDALECIQDLCKWVVFRIYRDILFHVGRFLMVYSVYSKYPCCISKKQIKGP